MEIIKLKIRQTINHDLNIMGIPTSKDGLYTETAPGPIFYLCLRPVLELC